MRKWTLIFLILVSLTGCTKETISAKITLEDSSSKHGQDVMKVMEKALTLENFPFMLLTDSNGIKQYWNGSQQLHNWRMDTIYDNQSFVLEEREGILFAKLDEQPYPIVADMYGIFSPRAHLQLLQQSYDKVTPLAEDNQGGETYYVSLLPLPKDVVLENISNLLGKQFQFTDQISDVAEHIRIHYVLWYNSSFNLLKFSVVIYDNRNERMNEQRLTYLIEEDK